VPRCACTRYSTLLLRLLNLITLEPGTQCTPLYFDGPADEEEAPPAGGAALGLALTIVLTLATDLSTGALAASADTGAGTELCELRWLPT
jgi:hypothetical protein